MSDWKDSFRAILVLEEFLLLAGYSPVGEIVHNEKFAQITLHSDSEGLSFTIEQILGSNEFRVHVCFADRVMNKGLLTQDKIREAVAMARKIAPICSAITTFGNGQQSVLQWRFFNRSNWIKGEDAQDFSRSLYGELTDWTKQISLVPLT